MDCQNTIKNLKINKDKNLGEVVIVVEGQSFEFNLLKHIFTNILDYNYIPFKRGKKEPDKFVSKSNNNSTVVVINTSSSNIKSIFEDQNYKDKIYEFLKTKYNRKLTNTQIYFIWDRDRDSNDSKIIKEGLTTFKSALDNDFEMNGLLLLSYPCVESFVLSNFNKNLWRKMFKNSKDAKASLSDSPKISNSKINEKTLLLAAENMHRTFREIGINDYDTSNFKKNNLDIFSYEEDTYKERKKYYALSLVCIMLIDLGIITEKSLST